MVLNGQLYPNTAGYTYNVAGNFICTGVSGTFSTVTAGTLQLNGANQSVVDATLSTLIAAGTGTKTTTGAISMRLLHLQASLI